MKSVPGHPRLYIRNGTYYHRAVVPDDISAAYGKSEEQKSLRTKEKSVAVKRLRVEAARIDQLFDDFRAKSASPAIEPVTELTPDQITELGGIYYRWCLDDDETNRKANEFDGFDGISYQPSFEEWGEHTDRLVEELKGLYKRRSVPNQIKFDAMELLASEQVRIKLKKNSSSFEDLEQECLKQAYLAAKARKQRNEGEIVDTPPKVTVSPTHPKLLQAVRQWIAEKSRSSWTEKTKNANENALVRFAEAAGDKPLNEYAKSDARKFKSLLLEAPARTNNYPSLANLPLPKLVHKAQTMGIAPMSMSNVNKMLGFAISFWNWAEANFDDIPSGIFDNLKIKTRQSPGDKRREFTTDELGKIFGSPIYTGCVSERKWKQHGSEILKDSGRYWVPLIALFTGARLAEIIQLRISDLKTEQEIMFFDIQNHEGSDKTLKISNSWRKIPVHQRLLDCGLEDFLEQKRNKRVDRVFNDIKKGNDGSYSSGFSKYFARYLEYLEIKTNKTTFHSFRHNFETACLNAGLSAPIINALQGHAQPDMLGVYGGRIELFKLNESIQQVEYSGLDLAHLLK